MLTEAPYILFGLAVVTIVVSSAYLLFAIWRVGTFQATRRTPGADPQPVTILKPLCGLHAGLYENLRSFCCQDYPAYQVVFGVRDPDDPAVEIVERLIREFPDKDILLVVDGQVSGANLKVSNLANTYKAAKHSFLILADSDMRVDQHYVSTVVAEFEDPRVGVVTCLYKGSAVSGLPSRLASMFINEWFLPSVLVSVALNELRFGLGATMAVRREALESIGGLKRLASCLADDHMLGKLISQQGYKIVLSNYVVENVVLEKSFKELLLHELRWARTIRTVQPLGHAFSFLMYGIPLAIVAGVMDELSVDTDIFELGFVAFVVGLRIILHYVVHETLSTSDRQSAWLVPVRDLLGFVVWAASFFGRGVIWRDRTFSVSADGQMTAKGYP